MRILKKLISVLLVITIFTMTSISAITSVTTFSDVSSSSWYYGYVNRLINLNITAGIGNNKYGPNNSVTRAEFITFLCKANGLTQTEGFTFTDTQNHWSKKWVSTAVAANIIDQNTEFYPNKAITRQEAVEMLCRSINLQENTEMPSPYSDVKSDMGYSNKAYEEYLMLGSVVNGQRFFYPSNNIKRSEVAAVIVNLVDYKANPESFKVAKKAELEQKQQEEAKAKEEAERYAAWKESVKNISPVLLNNTNGLVKGSVFESYKYLRNEEKHYLENWGAKYGMTPEQFENEMVRVGSIYANTMANANYNKLDTFESNLKSVWERNTINNSLKKNIDRVKKNTIVAEGEFITSTGMLLFADFGNPVLRGTIKYRYLSPTSTNVLKSETVGSTGKNIQLGVWYEQDYEVHYLPEKEGLKCTSLRAISDIRLAK